MANFKDDQSLDFNGGIMEEILDVCRYITFFS